MVGSDIAAFDALANRYRLQLLVALMEANQQDDDDFDPLTLLETDDFEDDMTELRIHLRHVHLPKLDDMGFIFWNRDTGVISKGPHWDEIAPVLRSIYDNRDELPHGWLPRRVTEK